MKRPPILHTKYPSNLFGTEKDYHEIRPINALRDRKVGNYFLEKFIFKINGVTP